MKSVTVIKAKRMKKGARQAKTEKLYGFLDTFMPDKKCCETEVNGYLLVKYWSVDYGKSIIEVYKKPLYRPHGRF